MYWIVFQRQKIQGMQGYPGGPMVESGPPSYQVVIVPAIFKCDTAEQACRAAARKTGGMGTYMAVEGTPWGVDLLADEGVEEVGTLTEEDVKERRIRQLERTVLERDEPLDAA